MFCSLAAVENEELIPLANFIFRKYEEKDTMIYKKQTWRLTQGVIELRQTYILT